MNVKGAMQWTFENAVDRVVGGQVVGYAAVFRDPSGNLLTAQDGYARAPWEDVSAGVPFTTATRHHTESMAKPVTGFGLAIAIEQWNTALNALTVPRIPIPIPLPTLNLTDAELARLAQQHHLPLTVAQLRRILGDGQKLAVTRPLTSIIGHRLTATPGQYVSQLTLQNLLEHHSYLQPQAGDGDIITNQGLWAWASALLARGLSAPPGSGDQYRNENYVLLRMAIEDAMVTDYQTYLRNNVWIPAGAPGATMVNPTPPVMDYRAMKAADAMDPATLPYPGIDQAGDWSSHGGADGWFVTAVEYCAFLAFVAQHAPAVPESVPIVTNHMGWYSGQTPLGTAYGHNGGLGWWWNGGEGHISNAMWLYPDGSSAVLLTNGDHPSVPDDLQSVVLQLVPSLDSPASFCSTLVRNPVGAGTVRSSAGSGTPPAPTGTSPAVTADAPLSLTAATNVALALFDGTTRVSPIATYAYAPEVQRPADTVTGTNGGLNVALYDGTVTQVAGVPHYDRFLLPNDPATALSTQAGKAAFVLEFTGHVTVPSAGTYTFHCNSDDGCVVYLDGVMIVNDDGEHGPTQADGIPVALAAGAHPIRILYSNVVGGATLDVWYTDAAGTRHELDRTNLVPA